MGKKEKTKKQKKIFFVFSSCFSFSFPSMQTCDIRKSAAAAVAAAAAAAESDQQHSRNFQYDNNACSQGDLPTTQ